MRYVSKLTAPGLVWASLVGLSGCATTAELKELRAEVEQANATATRAEAEVDGLQRELAALKRETESLQAASRPSQQTSPHPDNGSGNKWGRTQDPQATYQIN